MEKHSREAITDVIEGQPYYFGTAEDRARARELAQLHAGDEVAFHQAMSDAALFWGDTEKLYDDDWSLEALTARHRALARYLIYRHRLADDLYTRIKEPLAYTDLRFDEAKAICERLNDEAKAASHDYQLTQSSWGLTMYFPQLERPVPQLWVRPATAHPVSIKEMA